MAFLIYTGSKNFTVPPELVRIGMGPERIFEKPLLTSGFWSRPYSSRKKLLVLAKPTHEGKGHRRMSTAAYLGLLALGFGAPSARGTATSHFILAAMSFTGTMTHVFAGSLAHGLHRTVPLSIGVVIGAQLGARLSDHIGGRLIVRLLAMGLAVLGMRVFLLATGVWQ